MTVRNILILGNERLYDKSFEVERNELESINNLASDLHDTLMDFRKKNNAGRAIAAPQIGGV